MERRSVLKVKNYKRNMPKYNKEKGIGNMRKH